jgi:hypothetical protein
VTVAVRGASVLLAAKLTVMVWLLVELEGDTEVIHEALVVVVHSQLVPPVSRPNVVAEAPLPTLRDDGGPTVNEQGGRWVIV